MINLLAFTNDTILFMGTNTLDGLVIKVPMCHFWHCRTYIVTWNNPPPPSPRTHGVPPPEKKKELMIIVSQ